MPKLLILALFVLLSSVTAAEQWKDWTLYPKSEQPDKKIRTEGNQLTAEFNSDNAKRKYGELSATRTLALQKRKRYILSAVIEAEKAGEICFVYKHHDPYKLLGLISTKKLVPGENRIFLSFTAKEAIRKSTSSPATMSRSRISAMMVMQSSRVVVSLPNSIRTLVSTTSATC